MSDQRAIARALLSVSDKTGLIDFARALSERGVALISTGGTRKAIADAGTARTATSPISPAFPEMMDGRVKTLHPKVHGGLLAIREIPDHEAADAGPRHRADRSARRQPLSLRGDDREKRRIGTKASKTSTSAGQR